MDYKGNEIDSTPTDAMALEAERGLAWRDEFGRGGTEVGVARARDISNKRELSAETIRRMVSYFARHEVDKQGEGFSPGEEGYPSAGRIAWALWGGDPGQSWANRIADRLDKIDEGERMETLATIEKNNDNLDMEKRHIVNVEETETSYIVEFAKGEVAVEEETELPDVDLESTAEGENSQETVTVFATDRKDQTPNRMTRASEMLAEVKDERRIGMSISSEMSVDRSWGEEILDHSADAIDLSFLNSGRAPLLLDHDPTKQIGVIESVYLDGSARRLRANVRFGKSSMANEVYQDVVDNIRGNVSIGYVINKMVEDPKGSKKYRATSWTPLEVSVVSIPADTSVGVGRAADTSQSPNPSIILGESKMENAQTQVSVEQVLAARNKEIQEINALAIRHNQRNLADEAIAKGASIEQFRGMLLDKIGDKPLEQLDVGMTQKEVRQYSLMRAISAAAANGGRLTGFEGEISAELEKRYGKAPRGFYVPTDIFKRDILTSSPANGSNIIATDHLASEFVDALRANTVIMGMGARMISGLKGDVAIPAMNAKTAVAFVAENNAPTEGAPTFRQITMSPKTLAGYVDISRKLMMQSDPSVDQILRDDITRNFAVKIDEVAIEGGGANEPTGILGTNGIGSVAMGSNGGAITYAKLVDLEREVAIDNALTGSLAFLTNPKVVSAMRKTPRQSSGVEGNFILNDTNSLLGYNVVSTTSVPSDLTKGTASGVCSAVIFGNFNDLIIGMWGGLDILVDPYSGSAAGTTRIACFQDIDVKVRHAESFAAIKDVTTA